MRLGDLIELLQEYNPNDDVKGFNIVLANTAGWYILHNKEPEK